MTRTPLDLDAVERLRAASDCARRVRDPGRGPVPGLLIGGSPMSAIKIESLTDVTELDDKRANLPFKITATCPTCGVTVTRDLMEDYLAYPTVNGRNKINLYHELEDCEQHSWFIYARLTMSLEIEQ